MQHHERVLETISTLADDRKCYRLVGEILVQTTIGEARPALKSQLENLKEVVETFKQKTEMKSKEIQQFQVDNKIQIKPISELQEKQ